MPLRINVRKILLAGLLFSQAFGQQHSRFSSSSSSSRRPRVARRPQRQGMVGSPLDFSAKVLGGLNAVGFGFSVATGSHVHLDLIGTGAFAVTSIATRGVNQRSALSSLFISVWATRLAAFLFYRATQTPRDLRLEDTLSTPVGAFGFWLVSFAWSWLTMLPHTLACGAKKAPAFGRGMTTACVLYGFGLATEVIADFQKWNFKNNPKNRGKHCDKGLWQISQHPNYFGNMLLWFSIWLLNAPTILKKKGPGVLALSSISPLFLAMLFFGQSTGVIGPAVELADAKYNHLSSYQKYKKETPLIIPNPFKLIEKLSAALASVLGAGERT